MAYLASPFFVDALIASLLIMSKFYFRNRCCAILPKRCWWCPLSGDIACVVVKAIRGDLGLWGVFSGGFCLV
jgi:hypothetical protein